MVDGTTIPVPCPRCGGPLRTEMTKTAIWVGEDLNVVEDIPARLCDACMETFYDEAATGELQRLTDAHFPPEDQEREITVRVFSMAKRLGLKK